MKILCDIFGSLIVFILLLLVIRVIIRAFIKLNYSKNREIFCEEQVVLGEKKQTILLEGKAKNLPVMIMFHGGPFVPIVYGEGYRGFYPELSDHYILVWWDQYGCGKNYVKDKIPNLTVETWADMAVDLVDEIKKRFPENKIYLNGNSFGSYLSMYAASKREDEISGVINVGPILDMKASTNNYFMACESKLTDKERRELLLCKEKDYITYELKLESLAEKYTNCAHYKGKEGSDVLTLKWILYLFISPDYSWKDILGVIKPFGTIGRSYFDMWNSIGEVNIREITEKLTIPVMYLQGEEELYVLPQELSKIVEAHDNMIYYKIPYCGHIPTVEGWNKMVEKIIGFSK